MAEWIKRFIVWYLCKRCNAVFEYNGKVVRVFSKEFYDTEVREHLNSVARGRFNTCTPKEKGVMSNDRIVAVSSVWRRSNH